MENEQALQCYYIATAMIAVASIIRENEQPVKKRKIWTRSWLQRSKERGCYENLMRELALEVRLKSFRRTCFRSKIEEEEDLKSYRRWIRMDTATFEYLLQVKHKRLCHFNLE